MHRSRRLASFFLAFTLTLVPLAAGGLLGFGSPPASPSPGDDRGPALVRDDTENWPWQLTVYCAASAGRIDWSSASSLIRSYLFSHAKTRIGLGRLDMGHLYVHLRTAKHPRGRWSGMSDSDPGEALSLVRKHGYGLGILATDVAGKVHGGERTARWTRKALEKGDVAFLRVLVGKQTGERLDRYFDEYHAGDGPNHYGGANRPLHGEGGGCGQYAVSYLEVAGALEPEIVAGWRVQVRIPRDLFGGPVTGLKVSEFQLGTLVVAGRRWARAGEPGYDAVFWDPSRAFRWIRGGGKPGAYVAERRGEKGRGLMLDARRRAVPAGPIWKGKPQWGEDHPYARQRGVPPPP